MRLFLASFLSLDNTNAYDSLVAGVGSDVPGTIRPVPSGTQHLTIVFLGDVADVHLPTCLHVLESVGGFDSLDITLSAPRILFAGRSPRLVRVDLVSGSERVSGLQKYLHRELSERLPTPITPPKFPHITLARFRKNANRASARRVEESFSKRDRSSVPRTDHLTSVRLVKSTLTPEGPIYESVGVTGQ